MALSYLRRVSRLVLVGAQTPANELVLGLREEVRALEDPILPQFVREFQGAPSTIRCRTSSLRRRSQGASRSRPAPVAAVWRGAVPSIDQDYVVELREINVPTLIL